MQRHDLVLGIKVASFACLVVSVLLLAGSLLSLFVLWLQRCNALIASLVLFQSMVQQIFSVALPVMYLCNNRAALVLPCTILLY